ncbi:hypothetical protein L248_2135 [Schleiferilactobacillus shenzhenensis LY-73]|uniref:Uncharacterized protein n=1 Tax=Schleiferilactobacillus shenzhenensis LY-73 TaxID=1231336 RepID=U4TQS6_9LACO|nr:hypothetical protein L248_2135 [Schleiferilactobacillus shenzhenensis LY-73]
MRAIIEWIWAAPMWQVILFLPFLIAWFSIVLGIFIELVWLAIKGKL